MDMVLPRGAMRGLMTALCPSFVTPWPRLQVLLFFFNIINFSLSLSRFCVYSQSLKNFIIFITQIPMEKHSKDNEEAVKDQKREGHSKGECDYNPSKRVSDNILPHILNLYGSCATPRDFEIYAPDATFEDPLMRAHGVQQIKSAFYSLSKVFSESKIVEYTVKENEISNGKQEILIDNKQYYKMFGKDIDMISLIKLYVEQGNVVRHEDCWDKKPLRNRETTDLPLVGRILEISRRGSMMLTHAMMRFGKDPTP